MRRLGHVVAVVAVISAGCRDSSPVQPSPGSPTALIMDGAHEGNAFFFFLPPLVPNPNSFFHAGTFNAGLAPVVEVCELTHDPRLLPPIPAAECAHPDTAVFGPATMTLDRSNEHYQLNWDTKASVLSTLSFYRIIVRGAPGGTVLGFVDVDPVFQGMKNVRTGDVVAFQDGRTLPIKVRIENGAFGSANGDDRVEQVVPNIIPGGTLDVTTNTGFAGARFTSGWLPVGFDQVVVIIERIAVHKGEGGNGCLESGLQELEGCYRFRTDPDLHGLGLRGADLIFQIPVIAGVCFEIPDVAGQEGAPPFALHRREEIDGVLTGDAEALEDVDAPFLRCDGFTPTSPSIEDALRSGRLGDVATAGWRALARGIGRLVAPRALHAVDFGAGGNTNEFSRFGWARHSTMTVTEGDGVSAPAGSIVRASVLVETVHHDDSVPVTDQPVTFTTGDNGTLVDEETETETNTLTVQTNEAGIATVSWRLGAGENTLEVSTDHVTESPQFITATGTDELSIAFHSTRDAGDFEIYSMNIDGSGQTRITIHEGPDLGPAISPDGAKIAFGRDVGPAGEIYVINADGSGETRLTDNATHDAGPTWSPDGRKIAFRTLRDGNFEIYVMNADGTGQTRLTENGARDFDIDWSPDGSKIAFSSTRDDPQFDIYVMNAADGSGVTRLTASESNDVTPSWSPDGAKIAFTRDADVWVMNADGTGATQLTVGESFDGDPSWCPNGDIVFTSQRNGNFELYIMHADGTGQARLTTNAAADEEARCGRAGARIS